jgi:hypothetical protein
MLPKFHVWVFNGSSARFPSGVFSDLEAAKGWISRNRLTGVLTAYPMNEGVFDWAIANDCTNLSPAKVQVKASDPNFVGSFTSASQEHFHFEAGVQSD